ncbi:MAG: hypothetical protein MUE44_31845 [Oscillatoriaceae cyanobacterium Prado104]|jgi:hypothetical protein|nr:hypothetical protein [Oscillatoriaceae cyanobacterium Prado104]
MKFLISVSPKKVACFLGLWVLFFAVAGCIVQVLRYGFNYQERWIHLFNLDREINYPSWYSSLTLLFCGILLNIIAAVKQKEDDLFFRHWKVLGCLFVLFSLDEILSLHEILIINDLRKALNLGGLFYFIWVIPGAIFVAVIGLSYIKFLKHLPRQTRNLFLLAASIYVGGALGMEMICGYYADAVGQRNLIYGLLASVEEILEMIGAIIFIYALLSYIGSHRENIDLRFKIVDRQDR